MNDGVYLNRNEYDDLIQTEEKYSILIKYLKQDEGGYSTISVDKRLLKALDPSVFDYE